MPSSMTGFGRAAVERDGREMTVELKSVNHRYLDLGIRLPRQLNFLEDVLRKAVSAEFARGHVDIFVNYRNTRKDARTVSIDSALLSAYLTAAREANQEAGLADDLTLSGVLRLPDVTTITEADEDREIVAELTREAVKAAAAELRAMREKEGENLAKDLTARADTVLSLAERIGERAPLVVDEYRTKLNARIEDLLSGVDVDRARLATEVALFADKANIDEELVRLHSHVKQFKNMMKSDEAVGRKLDFIVQEMNREFNTIGSKANDAEIASLVIEGKAEIEKIREQVQNIE
ncbi:MAG: YicC family protein [Clostridia bacterium]|nr:YicC family protein [Clostridia bacterium]